VSQLAEITTSDGNQFFLPVQSANCDTQNPIEDVLSFGLLGAVTRIQNQVSTCRSTIKTYLNVVPNSSGIYTPGEQGTSGSGWNNTVNASLIGKLTGDALQGLMTVINVTPYGFIMSGILGRLNLDVANGALGTADLEFMGVGQPYYAGPPPTILGNLAQLTGQLTAFYPVNNAVVSGSAGLGCAQSMKFSLDIPNDVISCLGTNPSGSQTAVSGGYVMVAKAPFKANLTLEGYAVDVANTQYPINQTYFFGDLGVSFPKPIVTNRSVNQATNSVGMSYSFTVDDVSCNFQ
jgi:hypothetical protein